MAPVFLHWIGSVKVGVGLSRFVSASVYDMFLPHFELGQSSSLGSVACIVFGAAGGSDVD